MGLAAAGRLAGSSWLRWGRARWHPCPLRPVSDGYVPCRRSTVCPVQLGASAPGARQVRAADRGQHGLRLGKAQAPVRVAVTGRTVGLPLFESVEVLGRERTLARIDAAAAKLAARD